MVDFIVFNAAVQSGRALWEFVSANKHLAENRELVTAVSKINSDLMSAQNVALNAQQEQAVLAQRIRELEQKIVALENWDREAERYEPCSVIMGFSTYRLKSEVEQGEQLHYLCTNCFADKKKSILQFSIAAGYESYVECPRCRSKFMLDVTDVAHHFPDFYEKQRARMQPTK